MTIIAFKATPTEVQIIDQLIQFKHHKSRSDVLRHALLALAQQHKLKPAALKTLHAERRRRGTRDMRHYYR